jgi:subtilisin family serine protease
MGWKHLALILAVVLSTLLHGVAAQTHAPFEPGTVLVKFRAASAATQSAGADTGIQRLRVPDGEDMATFLKRVRSSPAVAFAEPNYYVHKAAVPDDPRYAAGAQWSLGAIAASPAWDLTTGGDVTVAIVDTGITYDHPDLAANMWTNAGEIAGDGVDNDGNGIVDDVHGACFDSNPDDSYGCAAAVTGDPMDDDTTDSHGTHVAGIIGAVGDNATGIAGVAWTVRLMAVKVIHGPLGLGTIADAADGIRYAADQGADIINLSFTVDGEIQTLADAIAYANDRGVLVVSAAGNEGRNLDVRAVSPASLGKANNIAVAATVPGGDLAAYSNYGEGSVALSAPGGDSNYAAAGVLSTLSYAVDSTGYGRRAGTSMAAPHVTGVAALLKAANPALTPQQLKARILNGAEPDTGAASPTITGGHLSAYGALAADDLPSVFAVRPRVVAAGDTVEILGANFGTGPYSAAVSDTALTVNQSGSTGIRLIATVPACAPSGRVRAAGAGSTYPLTVLHPDPGLRLQAEPVRGTAPFQATLTASFDGAPVSPLRAQWDFGDGSFGAEDAFHETVSHRFTTPGNRVVRLRITDGCGDVHTAEVTVKVDSGDGGRDCLLSEAYAWDGHPDLQRLRGFRDRILARSPLGREVTTLYYALSHTTRGTVARHPWLRPLVRMAATTAARLLEPRWPLPPGVPANTELVAAH